LIASAHVHTCYENQALHDVVFGMDSYIETGDAPVGINGAALLSG
jgi:hypothetical protein